MNVNPEFCEVHFENTVPFEGIKKCLNLTKVAMESMFPNSRVCVQCRVRLDLKTQTCTIDLSKPFSCKFTQLFVGFLKYHYGNMAIRITPRLDFLRK